MTTFLEQPPDIRTVFDDVARIVAHVYKAKIVIEITSSDGHSVTTIDRLPKSMRDELAKVEG